MLAILAAGAAFLRATPLAQPAAVRVTAVMAGDVLFPSAAGAKIESLSKNQLVILAKKAGLEVTGNKKDITLRITQHLSSPNADEAGPGWVAEGRSAAEISFDVDVAQAAKEVSDLYEEALDEAAVFSAPGEFDEAGAWLAFFEVTEETEVILPGYLPAPPKGYVSQGAAATAAAAKAIATKVASLKLEGAAAIESRRARRVGTLKAPPGYVTQGFAAAEAAAAARPSMAKGYVAQSSDAPFFEVTEETELVLHGHLWASKGYVSQGAAAAQMKAAATREAATRNRLLLVARRVLAITALLALYSLYFL